MIVERLVSIIAFICDCEYSPSGKPFRETFLLHLFLGDLQPKAHFSMVYLHRRMCHNDFLRCHNYHPFCVVDTTAWSLSGSTLCVPSRTEQLWYDGYCFGSRIL